MITRVLGLVATVLTLAACSSVDRGVVVTKTYHAPYTYVSFISNYCGNGCTIQTPIIMDVPECWGLWLRNGPDEGEVCVDRQTFDTLGPGASYAPPREQ